ncbi:RNA ligase/cyclic nucleotide phosphodiesterase [Rhodocollybia butyracea]|uniref:RNA ligase/cyclic nucleotide phosphodiesterase n=1 Tax=Rhodocollybia butyracea TaxID=206335 RepID=A0A9P5U6B9_9AGAR|nr:RNA ligase/cyclic nucleotide phosphodiesterase [Rhodocollybia butyracea]
MIARVIRPFVFTSIMVTLWIVPSDEDSAKLQRIMAIRPNPSASSSESYPNFYPHITLAAPLSSSPLTLDQIRESISKYLPHSPISIKFKSVDTGSVFFRSVYIVIEPSSELISLHEHIHTSLSLEPRTPLYPHLSLCYITDKDECERARWRQLLEDTGRIRNHSMAGVEMNCAVEGGKDDWLGSFVAHEIWLVNCVGPVEEWSILDKVRLDDR